jgi:hypothetical protein
MLAELSGKPAERGAVTRASAKVPAIANWKVPIGVIVVLFGTQALIAALVDDQTIGSIFAVGAVVVAVLTAIVAALSYAQQSAVPLKEFVAVLKEIPAALKAVVERGENGDPNGGDAGGSAGPSAGARPPRPSQPLSE